MGRLGPATHPRANVPSGLAPGTTPEKPGRRGSATDLGHAPVAAHFARVTFPAYVRALAVALVSVAFPVSVSGQLGVLAGAAASVPLGPYGDVATLGVQGRLGVVLGQDAGLRFAAHGFWDRNPHRIPADHSVVYGLNVLVGFGLSAAYELVVTPWTGLGGAVHARRSEQFPGLNASRRGLAVTAGATVARPMGGFSPFLSAFYERGLGGLDSDRYPTGWLTVGGGVEIPLGD